MKKKLTEGEKAYRIALILLLMVGAAAYFMIGALLYYHIVLWFGLK